MYLREHNIECVIFRLIPQRFDHRSAVKAFDVANVACLYTAKFVTSNVLIGGEIATIINRRSSPNHLKYLVPNSLHESEVIKYVLSDKF